MNKRPSLLIVHNKRWSNSVWWLMGMTPATDLAMRMINNLNLSVHQTWFWFGVWVEYICITTINDQQKLLEGHSYIITIIISNNNLIKLCSLRNKASKWNYIMIFRQLNWIPLKTYLPNYIMIFLLLGGCECYGQFENQLTELMHLKLNWTKNEIKKLNRFGSVRFWDWLATRTELNRINCHTQMTSFWTSN